MINILLYSILFIEILFAISCAITYQGKVNDQTAVKRQIVISIAFSLEGFAYIAMLLTSSEVLSYFLYAISWYSGVVLLANLFLMSAYSMNYDSYFVKYIISVIYYLGIVIYFVDTFISKGVLVHESVGVSYLSYTTLQIIMHSLYYAVFIASLAFMFANFTIRPRKKRDRYLLTLWVLTFSFVLVGVLFEFFELLLSSYNIPFVLLTCIGTILLLPKLLKYHRDIDMREDDYSEYLKNDVTDIVLICDDEYNIRFINKRAVIIGQVIKEEFKDRKLLDVFRFSPDVENLLYDDTQVGKFTIYGKYAPLDKNISLDIMTSCDKFGELFSSVIVVKGLEDDEEIILPEELTETSKEVTVSLDHPEEYTIANGARVLIFIENSIRLNVFEKLLQPYSLTVSRVSNLQMAYKEIIDNTFDIIFVDQNLSKISPFEFTKKIRSLDDNYYKVVPICLCTDIPMDDQYMEFLEAGFTDFINKPISADDLNLVLTRWLWKRYTKENKSTQNNIIYFESDTSELRELLNDCNMFYEKKDNLLLAGCLRAIRQQCVMLNLAEFEYDARALYKSVILGDTVFFEKQYNSFQTGFLKAIDTMSFKTNNYIE